MIPSGYKEDTVYSVVPSDGSGDLSFTRASNGTRVNSAGLVEVVPWNLFGYSEDGTSGQWGNPVNIASVTLNSTTAPNGTNTGNLVVENSANGNHWFEPSFASINGTPYTISAYFKAKERTQCALYGFSDNGVFSQQQVIFDLSTGTVVSQSGTQTNAIENVGNGWYRCSMTITANASSAAYFGNGLANAGSTSYAGNGTSGLYMWGRQLNTGTLKPYFPTTDRLNVPRLTYQNGGGGCPSLLLEKQSTNLVTYSEQFDNGDWFKEGITVTANATTSPDGTQNADTLTPTTANQIHRIEQDKATATQVFTQSIFAKANGYNFIALENGGEIAYFNISTGVVGTVSSGTASIQNMGNGWYRCIFTATALNGKSYFYVANADNSISFAGNATSGIYVWGAQFEAGSYATSYIQSTSSSATRVADACFKTGISSLIGQTQGTLFMDMVPTDVSGAGRYMNLYNGSNSSNGWNAIISNGNTPNTFRFYGDGFDFSGGACLFGVRVKVALAYKNGVLTSAYVNGASVGTLTAVTTGKSYDTLTLGEGPFGVAGSCNVNESIIFPTALTNAELASLTTI